jgi:GC-rich sequence DNA-binding factor
VFQLYSVVEMLATVDRIVNDSRTVFDDVVEDFVDAELICKRFARWRSEHTDSYTEAYISLCVSKLVVPLVRHSLIAWNPLQVSAMVVW